MKLAKLLKRYTENKEELMKNAKDLYKVSSILRRDSKFCFLYTYAYQFQIELSFVLT